jgi:hypothetical protein
MATTTTNFGWDIPQSTDLVKDGATAIAALGQDIDTAFIDLKGGTTGQVLAKQANTDLDFTWVTPELGDITAVTAGTGISGGGTTGAVTVTNSMATAIDAKGDLVPGTGADTFSRLAVGANGTVLTADSAEATGLKWSTVGSGLTLVKAQTIGSAVSSVTVTSAFNTTYDNYLINISGGVGSVDANIALTLGSATSGYKYGGIYLLYSGTTVTGEASNGAASFPRAARGSTNSIDGEVVLKNPFNTKRTAAQWRISSTIDGQLWAIGGGVLDDATSYTAFTLTPASGTLTGGTIRVYGYQNS